MLEYTDGFLNNPLWGDGSWAHYLQLIFDNPAAGSAAIDFSIANVLLLPLITIVDGRRRGINKPWLFFVVTLFASFSFGWAFYAATVERQRRLAARGSYDRVMEIVASWPSQMSLHEVGPWARRVEDLGFDVMHVPETVHDPFVVSAIAAAATERLVIRTSMVVAFPRSPMLTAISAWDLTALSSGRFQLGLASQVRGNIVGRFSTEWSEPVSRLGDYIRSVRAIFEAFQTGADLSYVGSHYRFERLQPYFNPGPLEHAAPRSGAAA